MARVADNSNESESSYSFQGFGRRCVDNMNVNGFAPYTKYNWCSRCRRYIPKGEVCEFHPNCKLRTSPRYTFKNRNKSNFKRIE